MADEVGSKLGVDHGKAGVDSIASGDKRHLQNKSKQKFRSVEWVADVLDVSTRTVFRWIKSGQLKAHKFGAIVRIADDDLRGFYERHRED
jgi:excisionase family DNA binding protein